MPLPSSRKANNFFTGLTALWLTGYRPGVLPAVRADHGNAITFEYRR
jgi:hypothetical protein